MSPQEIQQLFKGLKYDQKFIEEIYMSQAPILEEQMEIDNAEAQSPLINELIQKQNP